MYFGTNPFGVFHNPGSKEHIDLNKQTTLEFKPKQATLEFDARIQTQANLGDHKNILTSWNDINLSITSKSPRMHLDKMYLSDLFTGAAKVPCKAFASKVTSMKYKWKIKYEAQTKQKYRIWTESCRESGNFTVRIEGGIPSLHVTCSRSE
jgi:hypothetical protein